MKGMIIIAILSNNLIIDRCKYKSGAAFNLLKKHELNEVMNLGNGWELVLDSESPYVILRGKSTESDLGKLFNTCFSLVQKGLDILSINGKGDISLSDSIDAYIIWWNEQSKQFLRIYRVTDFRMGASVEVTVSDKNGKIIKYDNSKPTEYHESLRYYRLSQITDDLFDSFRNMYLSFESLLSIQTKRRKGEKEGEWIKRGLNNINSSTFAHRKT